MEPMVVRRKDDPKETVVCKDCGNWARAVWLDDGGAVPLCDDCVEARRKAYRERSE